MSLIGSAYSLCTSSLPDVNSVRCLITSADKSGDFAERLKQYRTNCVTLLPILRQASCATFQNIRCKVGNADPWQDQKTGVVDYQIQVLLAAF